MGLCSLMLSAQSAESMGHPALVGWEFSTLATGT